ncbi:hypothetical protein STPH1_4731 [Streptomyces sp. OM5714]|nr:hypothetical protein STPH1_4731 [Streptomyces sp. OM5714]
MSAAAELSGWLRVSTSSAAVVRSFICQAVTAPKAITSTASSAPMMRSRPGSVTAAARSRSTPSAKAVRRRAGGDGGGGGEGGDGGADSAPPGRGPGSGAERGGTAGGAGTPVPGGGAAPPFGG